MKFCSECGSGVEQLIPEGDDHLRFVCRDCETIHYQNPKIICGCIPVWEDKVLLCKRAIQPRSGFWTLPAGFMELNETTVEGAIRETWEEARARVEVEDLYCVFSLAHNDQVHLMFRSRMLSPEFEPGPESTDVQLFSEDEIPWNDLAFETIRQSLRHFYQDRPGNLFPTRFGDVIRQGDGYAYEVGKKDDREQS